LALRIQNTLGYLNGVNRREAEAAKPL
jgi:hypothetical protein